MGFDNIYPHPTYYRLLLSLAHISRTPLGNLSYSTSNILSLTLSSKDICFSLMGTTLIYMLLMAVFTKLLYLTIYTIFSDNDLLSLTSIPVIPSSNIPDAQIFKSLQKVHNKSWIGITKMKSYLMPVRSRFVVCVLKVFRLILNLHCLYNQESFELVGSSFLGNPIGSSRFLRLPAK